VGQGGLKVFHLWRYSQKIPTPNQKIFLQVQTTRLAESFELLTGLVAFTGPKKFPCKAKCDPAVFPRTTRINPGAKVWKTSTSAKKTKNFIGHNPITINLVSITFKGIMIFINLTPYLPSGFTFKTRVSHFFTITLQLHNSPGNWARELFKPSKYAVSLPVRNFKKCKNVLDFLVGLHKWGRFRPFWPRSSSPRP